MWMWNSCIGPNGAWEEIALYDGNGGLSSSGLNYGELGGVWIWAESGFFEHNALLSMFSSDNNVNSANCVIGCHMTPVMDMTGGGFISDTGSETYPSFYSFNGGRPEPNPHPKFFREGVDKIDPINFDEFTLSSKTGLKTYSFWERRYVLAQASSKFAKASGMLESEAISNKRYSFVFYQGELLEGVVQNYIRYINTKDSTRVHDSIKNVPNTFNIRIYED